MGLSSSKTKTKPIYSAQIEGAANKVSGAYDQQAPKLTAITDSIASLAPTLADTFRNGDPNLNAAKSYDRGLLEGSWDGGGPLLQNIIDSSLNDSRNQTTAALGLRGLTAGSTAADIVSRNAATIGDNLRYTDLNNYRSRQEAAAGRAGMLASAGYLPLQALLDTAQAQSLPLQAANAMGSGIGGLLGQYTQTKQSGNIGQLLAGLAGSALGAFAGGGLGSLGGAAGAAGASAAPSLVSIGTNGGFIPRTLR